MPKRVKCYHIKDGEAFCFEVDARDRVQRHPEEWSMTPWSETKAARKTDPDAEAKAKAATEAKKKTDDEAKAKADAEAKAKAEAGSKG